MTMRRRNDAGVVVDGGETEVPTVPGVVVVVVRSSARYTLIPHHDDNHGHSHPHHHPHFDSPDTSGEPVGRCDRVDVRQCESLVGCVPPF